MSEVGITAATNNLREASAEIRRSGSRQLMPPAIREEQQPPPKSTEPRRFTEVPPVLCLIRVAIHTTPYSARYVCLRQEYGALYVHVCTVTVGGRSIVHVCTVTVGGLQTNPGTGTVHTVCTYSVLRTIPLVPVL